MRALQFLSNRYDFWSVKNHVKCRQRYIFYILVFWFSCLEAKHIPQPGFSHDQPKHLLFRMRWRPCLRWEDWTVLTNLSYLNLRKNKYVVSPVNWITFLLEWCMHVNLMCFPRAGFWHSWTTINCWVKCNTRLSPKYWTPQKSPLKTNWLVVLNKPLKFGRAQLFFSHTPRCFNFQPISTTKTPWNTSAMSSWLRRRCVTARSQSKVCFATCEIARIRHPIFACYVW